MIDRRGFARTLILLGGGVMTARNQEPSEIARNNFKRNWPLARARFDGNNQQLSYKTGCGRHNFELWDKKGLERPTTTLRDVCRFLGVDADSLFESDIVLTSDNVGAGTDPILNVAKVRAHEMIDDIEDATALWQVIGLMEVSRKRT